MPHLNLPSFGAIVRLPIQAVTLSIMRLNRLIAILVTSTINFGSASPTFAVSGAELSSIIEDEREIALHGVLDNIGPHGKKAPGALAGVVVASPSTEDPNCTSSLLLHIMRRVSHIWSFDCGLT